MDLKVFIPSLLIALAIYGLLNLFAGLVTKNQRKQREAEEERIRQAHLNRKLDVEDSIIQEEHELLDAQTRAQNEATHRLDDRTAHLAPGHERCAACGLAQAYFWRLPCPRGARDMR